MKYYKFEKVVTGENPVIRITYKNWLGNLIVRDVCRASVRRFWQHMDDGSLVNNMESITTFNESNLNTYYLNKTTLT